MGVLPHRYDCVVHGTPGQPDYHERCYGHGQTSSGSSTLLAVHSYRTTATVLTIAWSMRCPSTRESYNLFTNNCYKWANKTEAACEAKCAASGDLGSPINPPDPFPHRRLWTVGADTMPSPRSRSWVIRAV